jgi:hypothetical protein
MRPLAARHFHALLLAVRAGQFDDRATRNQCTAAAVTVTATATENGDSISAGASAGLSANNGTNARANAGSNTGAIDASATIAQARAYGAIIATEKNIHLFYSLFFSLAV